MAARMTRLRWFLLGAGALLALGAGQIGSVVTTAPVFGKGTAQDPIRVSGLSTSGNATTATALAANGANCTAGSYPLGVNASGAVEDCTAVTATETDPQVGTLTASKWCTTDGTQVNCATDPPVLVEDDPQVSSVVRGKWCTGTDAGSGIVCDKDPPVTSETPLCAEGEFVTSDGGGFLCKRPFVSQDMALCPLNYVLKRTDAGVVCTDSISSAGYATGAGTAETATGATSALCAGGYVLTSTDAGFTCITDGVGQVDTGKWCVGSYGSVVCNRDEPNALALATLSCTTGEVPIWSGTAWGCGYPPAHTTKLTADRASTSKAYANVTGLGWTVAASTRYALDCYLSYTTAATTTGIAVAINGPAESTMSYTVEIWNGSAWETSPHTVFDDTLHTDTVVSAGAVYPIYLRAWLLSGGSGTLYVRLATEVDASAATLKAGSWCRVE